MRRVRAQLPFHALVAVVLTWPLAPHLADSLPLGVETTGTVPLFNLWTLRWNQQQIGDLFRHYWDAPIFHPTPGTFALSEPQPLTGLFFSPLSWLTQNPVLAYNLTLLAILTLNGWAAARLARRFGAGPWPAAIAGLMAQALPFVANQLGVLQLTALFPIFFLADALLAWAPEGGRRRAMAIGLWWAATFLTCGYYGLFVTVVLGLSALTLVRRNWFTWSRATDGALAVALFAVLVGPFLAGQARYTETFSRSEATITDLSALPVDYLLLAPADRGRSIAPWLADEGGTDHWLYPGTLLVVAALAGIGIVVAESSRRTGTKVAQPEPRFEPKVEPQSEPETETELESELHAGSGSGFESGLATATRDQSERAGQFVRMSMTFAVTGMCVALILSLGLRLTIGTIQPYDLLRQHVPGFKDLRSPYRFAVLVQVFLIPLAAIAFDRLWRWRWVPAPADSASPGLADTADSTDHRRSWPVGVVVLVTFVGLGLVEVVPLPQRLIVVDQTRPDWVQWLADPANNAGTSGDGSVAMVPAPPDGLASSYEPTSRAMLHGLDHGRPLVNGYSGLFPPSYEELNVALRGFPSIASVQHLRDAGVTYVVVERSFLTPEAQGWMNDWSRELEPVFNGDDRVIYRLNR